jgi:hypothetical protein
MFLNSSFSGLPDGTYQFGMKNNHWVAVRLPKSNEPDQRKKIFIAKGEEQYQEIEEAKFLAL